MWAFSYGGAGLLLRGVSEQQAPCSKALDGERERFRVAAEWASQTKVSHSYIAVRAQVEKTTPYKLNMLVSNLVPTLGPLGPS